MTNPHEHLAAAVLNTWPVYIGEDGYLTCDHPTCPPFLAMVGKHHATFGDVVDALHAHIREHHREAVT